MEIVGSIDNAFHLGIGNNGGVFHLIFTTDTLFAAQVVSNREKRQRMAIASNTPLNMVSPLVGSITTYQAIKDETLALLEDGVARGTEIEKDLNGYIESQPEGLITLRYDNIDKVEFAQGTLTSLPLIEFIYGRKKLKYHLNHDNFQKAGKLEQNVYEGYRNLLMNVFEEKLVVKR